MASFLAQRSVPRRSQKVSHGGLGGCVQIKPEEQGHEDTSKLTWPLRRKRRPLAVNTNLIKPERSLSTMTPTSVVLHNVAIYEGLDPPQSDEVKTARLEEDIVELLSPMKRDEMEGGSNVFAERPQTPPTPEQTAPLLVELPGSILLPSQGFPQQNPPVTPARDDWHGFGSDVSRPSSTPSLDTSSTTDSEMEIFKNLTSPNKRSGRANTFPASPAKNGSKPFKAMTAEELMECLPELSMSVVSHHWVPAMENELKKIKILLQEAAEARLQSHIELETLGSVRLSLL